MSALNDERFSPMGKDTSGLSSLVVKFSISVSQANEIVRLMPWFISVPLHIDTRLSEFQVPGDMVSSLLEAAAFSE